MKVTIKLPGGVIARMLEQNRTPWGTPPVEECVQSLLSDAAIASEVTEGDHPNQMLGPPIVRQWTDVTVDVRTEDLGWILTHAIAHEVRSRPVPVHVEPLPAKEAEAADDDLPF